MTVAQLPTVEGEKPERDELLFFSPVLLFFCSFFVFSRQFKSSPLCSSTLFSKQSQFLSQTIPCFLLSIRLSSSSSFPKFFAPSGFLFFLFLPFFLSSPFSVFIAKRRESPPCLVPSRRGRETRLPYPCRVRWPVVCKAWVVLMVVG